MSRREAVLPRRQLPLAVVRPDLAFAWERFPGIARELLPLFKRHWQEIAVNKKRVPLDPNFKLFCDYDLVGVLRVLTVRAQGKLIGYVFVMVGPHLHYASTTWCHVDMFYLEPEHRRGRTGIRMFNEVELHARDAGAAVIYATEKLHFKNRRGKPVGRLFRYLGYRPTERVYSKTIG